MVDPSDPRLHNLPEEQKTRAVAASDQVMAMFKDTPPEEAMRGAMEFIAQAQHASGEVCATIIEAIGTGVVDDFDSLTIMMKWAFQQLQFINATTTGAGTLLQIHEPDCMTGGKEDIPHTIKTIRHLFGLTGETVEKRSSHDD